MGELTSTGIKTETEKHLMGTLLVNIQVMYILTDKYFITVYLTYTNPVTIPYVCCQTLSKAPPHGATYLFSRLP